jgi:uncharacterized membrane protein YfcA
MPGIVAAIIAAVIGAILGIGGGIVLTSSQGGGAYPEQNQDSITVYGTN